MNETIFHQVHHVQKLKIVHSNDKSHPRLRELFLMDIFTQLLFFLLLAEIWCPFHITNLFIIVTLSVHAEKKILSLYFIINESWGYLVKWFKAQPSGTTNMLEWR